MPTWVDAQCRRTNRLRSLLTRSRAYFFTQPQPRSTQKILQTLEIAHQLPTHLYPQDCNHDSRRCVTIPRSSMPAITCDTRSAHGVSVSSLSSGNVTDLSEGIKYQETHKRCPANVVAVEYRLDEKCGMLPASEDRIETDLCAGDCRESPSPLYTLKRKASKLPSRKDTGMSKTQ